ncbi:HIT family protein [Clostridium senegalense]|uniref:HIT family protein n=1 Tax=Clostridium senegalense TaxID=1465809 RepID=UPI0002896345|nr:HIT family protein [Clostridium senegalense]
MCLGCRLANNELGVYKVYENNFFSVILDKAPFNEGHLLILPKRHVKEIYDLTLEELNNLSDVLRSMSKLLQETFSPDGITIIQNGGIFNDLSHLHVNVIPRYENDGFNYGDPENKYCANLILNKTQNKLIEKIKKLKI